MIGAYFSKPDWHCQDYWWNERPTPDRNVNYDIREHPDRWRRYQDFTSRQIGELMTGYGLIDILWLDGGWVRPKNTLTEEVLSWGAPIPDFDQSIDLPGIAARARTEQPGLLIVDRTVHGELENYRTPERRIPEDPLPYPWESCLPLGNNWGFVPGDPLKSPTTVIHSLIEIVAKGGSLLLGIGPRPDGTLDDEALTILADMGGWMKRNGEAIYETRSTSPYRDGETFFTRGKDGTRYALVRIPEGAPLPSLITWKRSPPETGSSMVILGEERDVLWRQEGDTTLVTLPAAVQGSASPALVLRFSPAE
jgi:alpha-L-fucosidase